MGYTILQAALIILSFLKSLLKRMLGLKIDRNDTLPVEDNQMDQSRGKYLRSMLALRYKIQEQDSKMKHFERELTNMKKAKKEHNN